MVDAAHGVGGPAPVPDSTADAAAVGTTLTMTELATKAPFLRTQSGGATPETVPEVDTTIATGATTTGDDDDNELEVIMGHPGLRAPGNVSLSEEMGVAHFALCQAQEVLQQERANIEEER
jgi:hypothetical protein